MLNAFSLIFIFSLFFLKSFYNLDPDFGWHLKMGEIILKNGILATDPFSYTMPSFPFVDHEWITNILLYILYTKVGTLGLSVVFASLGILTFLIYFQDKYKKYFSLYILFGGGVIGSVGIRPQLITWVLFSILIKILTTDGLYKKYKFFLPLLFLIWANLHAGFALGIVVFLLFLILKIFKEKKFETPEIILGSISILATLINPYGIRLWGEVWMQISDSSLRWSIIEWKPAILSFNFLLWALVSFSLFLFFRYRKKLNIFEKALYLLLLFMGISSIRHMTLWTIFALPLFLKTLSFLGNEAKKYKYGQERFKKAYLFSVFLIFFILFSIVSLDLRQGVLTPEEHYPIDAISYLEKHPTSGQIFSNYGWGGYLIWKLSSKKVFIDGRMPSWRRNNARENESSYAFSEYLGLMNGTIEFKEARDKYGIDTVLLPVRKKQKSLTEFVETKFLKKERGSDIYSYLKEEGWRQVYKDNVAIIYRK